MSTKKIREVLEELLSGADESAEDIRIRAALAEVDAIEKAACVLVNIWGYAGDENPAEVLMRAIAAQRSGGTTGAKEAGASGPQE